MELAGTAIKNSTESFRTPASQIDGPASERKIQPTDVHAIQEALHEPATKLKIGTQPVKLQPVWIQPLIIGGLLLSLIDNLRGRLISGPFNLIGLPMAAIGFIASLIYKK